MKRKSRKLNAPVSTNNFSLSGISRNANATCNNCLNVVKSNNPLEHSQTSYLMNKSKKTIDVEINEYKTGSKVDKNTSTQSSRQSQASEDDDDELLLLLPRTR